MVVGVLRLELLLPENHSLKGKRSVLRAIRARVQEKFNVSIAECEDQDAPQQDPTLPEISAGTRPPRSSGDRAAPSCDLPGRRPRKVVVHPRTTGCVGNRQTTNSPQRKRG